MKKSLLLYLIALTFQIGFSQSGPGGVGTNDGSSTLELWLDPDEGISTTGVLIDSWADQSGNSLTMSSSGSDRPDLVTAMLNNHDYSSFVQSSDEYLGISAAISSIGSGNNRTILYVFQFTANSNNLEIFGNVTAEMFDYGTFNQNDRLRIRNGGADVYSGSNSVSQNAWHIGSADYDGTTTRAWNDNTSIINTASSAFAWGITSTFKIGGTNHSLARSFTGYIAEVILYSEVLNTAQRIILENYLAAKFGLTLDANDIYDEDDNGAGDYDFEMAGIGQASDATNHTDAQSSGFVRILNAGDLGNDEFLMWGHDNAILSGTNTSDVPAGVQARIDRLWRASEESSAGAAVDVGSIDIRFDLTGFGAVTTSDLRLLVDADNDGVFTDETAISGASSLGGNVYAFTGITAITDNLRFTLGTSNNTQTPLINLLPVDLISLNVTNIKDELVRLDWRTASEINNHGFEIESSTNNRTWENIGFVKGAGDSFEKQSYQFTHDRPADGINYYRLKQIDFDGAYEYSDVVSVELSVDGYRLLVAPNPVQNGELILTLPNPEFETGQIELINSTGQRVMIQQISDSNTKLDVRTLPKGIYWLNALIDGKRTSEKTIIQ